LRIRRHDGPPFFKTVRGRKLIRSGIIVAGAMVAGYLLSAVWLFPAPIFSRDHSIPRVLDLGLTEAQERLTGDGFRVKIAAEEPDPRAVKGRVIWQDPPPGTIVPEGSTIELTPSAGPPSILVPDVVNFDAAQARKVILAAGLSIGREDSVQSSLEEGVVVQTRPGGGLARDAGTAVDLVLSSGPPQTGVPSVIGMSLDDARQVVQRVGLTIGGLRVSASQGPNGVVLEQSPSAGSRLVRGSRVDLVISGREDS
jgi:eukaryotic-like serine/threonine-protein kinase